jgi:hypothetical protein
MEAPEERSLPALLAPALRAALIRLDRIQAATAIVLFIDELQYVPEEQLAALIAALRAANQAQLPVPMGAAGLPQLLARTGRAKSYAERLFEFVSIDQLDNDSAITALRVPIVYGNRDISKKWQ